MFNLLVDPVIRAILTAGEETSLALPELYTALFADAVESFSALRPHQRHAWHALLCQLGALACIRSGLAKPPADTRGWRDALRKLTPDFPDDEPWRLVSNLDKPAFLQPVVGPVEGYKLLATPDELDILVTAKNHDVKGARLADAQPDDWLFALVTLQTTSGYMGKENYGVSRMRSGWSNRSGFSIAPRGGIGTHVRRDLERLIDLREKILDDYVFYDENGLALVWLKSWSGTNSVKPDALDPYYIEICRRIRLVADGDGTAITARTTGSKMQRIAFGEEVNGVTGDPWTPIKVKDGDAQALVIGKFGLSYKQISWIIFENGFKLAPLQHIFKNDPSDSVSILIARALASGDKGKTEGFHERRIAISPRASGCFRRGEIEPLAKLSGQRIQQAGLVRKALRFGLMMLFQNGPTDFKPTDPNSAKRADPLLDRFETEVDRDFFEALFVEVEIESEPAKREARGMAR